MCNYKAYAKMFVMPFLLAMFVVGCGNGEAPTAAPGGGGGSSTAPTVTPGTPGTDPRVTSSSPTNLAINVPTSSAGEGAGAPSTGKLVTATFSEAMDPATVISPELTFTLKETVADTDVPGAVTMNPANTIATFTPTAAALITNTNYTAMVTIAAKNAGGTAMASNYQWSFTTAGTAAIGQAGLNLGTSSTYVIFASAADVTLQANAVVSGDVGLNPASACNGCVLGTTVINGVINNGNQLAIDAQTDFNAAYTEASVRDNNACPVAGELSGAQAACAGYSPATPGPIYGPGLYRSAVPIGVGDGLNITLDAGGDPDAVFIFQTNTALTTGTGSVVNLAGLAQAKNVYWVVGSAATLGVSSTFKGTVLADGAAVTVLNGVSPAPLTQVDGRLFSHSAAAQVNSFATVTVPAP